MVGVLSNKIQRHELSPGDHIYSWRLSYVYAHHGIYVGNGNVIHFTRGAGQEIGTGTILDRFIFSSSPPNPSVFPCRGCGDRSRVDGVISSCLECFLSGGELYKFQYGVSRSFFLAQARGGTCTLALSNPAEDVIYRAEYLLQNGFGNYDLFKNNCEDFAIYCKTGLLINARWNGRFGQIGNVGRSGQAASFRAAAGAIPPLYYMAPGFTVLAAVGCGILYCSRRMASDIGVRSDVTRVPVERFEAQAGLDEPEVPGQSGLDEPEVPAQSALDEPEVPAQSGLDEPEVPIETPNE